MEMEEIHEVCPICSVGTVIAVQLYLAHEGSTPVWSASCTNLDCVGCEGGEVMGKDNYEFPSLEWAEEFGVYIDGDN